MDGDVRVPVFTLTLAANNLDYTPFALHQPLDHNAPGTEDELYLKLEFTATDGDDDTAKGMVKWWWTMIRRCSTAIRSSSLA